MHVCSGACCARVGPSMLSADLANLASEARSVLDAGADFLHLDVMDGNFVPNITWGMPVIESLRKHEPDAFFDCHMMVSDPAKWVDSIAKAGGTQYTFHFESLSCSVNPIEDITDLCRSIAKTGMKVGIALKPETPAHVVAPFGALLDSILVMTVEPGFGGQSFMPNQIPKIVYLRNQFPAIDIGVDGGIGEDSVQVVRSAGANSVIAGSAVFNSKNKKNIITILKKLEISNPIK